MYKKITLLSIAIGLVACNTNATMPEARNVSSITLNADLFSKTLGAQGIPVGEQGGAVQTVKVEIREDGQDTALRFNQNGEIVPNGGKPYIILNKSNPTATIELNNSKKYNFKSYGYSTSASTTFKKTNLLAYAEQSETIQANPNNSDKDKDNTVNIALKTVLGGATLKPQNNLDKVEVGQKIELALSVYPNGNNDLIAPISDYTTSYTAENGTIKSESNLGVEVQVSQNPTGNTLKVIPTIEGYFLKEDGTVSKERREAAPYTVNIKNDSSIFIGVDLEAPELTELSYIDGVVTGNVRDNVKVAAVEVYAGSRKVGGETEGLNSSSDRNKAMAFTIEIDQTLLKASDKYLTVIARDSSGTETRKQVQINK